MTGLVLTPKGAFEGTVDLTGVLPSAKDLAKLKVGYGATRVELGELFEVSGAPNGSLTIEGGGAALDRVGAGLTEGEIIVKGDVGAGLGLRMTGGSISVSGSAGDYAAGELSGGRIAIAGSAGARLGAAGDGAKRGMSGGVVVVGGSVGARAGERLRGGVILIEGDAADGLGTSMIAGSLAALGKVGKNAGRGMKRGTLFISSPEGLAAGFGDAGEHDLVMLRVLVRRSPELKAAIGSSTRARRFAGDLTIGGKGEALIIAR